MPKFTDALDKKLEEVDRPPVVPVGHYTLRVTEHPEFDEFESRKTGDSFERVTYKMAIVEASDDVDPDELENYGNVAGAPQRKQFLFNNDDDTQFARTEFQHRQFLEALGISAEMPMKEALAESVGQECLGEIKHRPDPEDPEVIYTEVGRCAEL